jgi:hypothetical protein
MENIDLSNYFLGSQITPQTPTRHTAITPSHFTNFNTLLKGSLAPGFNPALGHDQPLDQSQLSQMLPDAGDDIPALEVFPS